MNTIYDFHSHSTASDGSLSPTELVRRAGDKGVDCLALTDHDTTAGLEEARQAALDSNLRFLPGIELSINWESHVFHVVGLNIDPGYEPLQSGVRKLAKIRHERAEEIGRRLEKKGITGVYEQALQLAADGMITRTHFAKVLLERQCVPTLQKAFDRYLGRGKPGYVAARWTNLDEGIGWITGCGGTAVLAHPRRYRITASRLRKFLAAFVEAGGESIEVVCGNSNPEDIHISARFAREFGLLGSSGSDFHSPESSWVELGRLHPMPADIAPVWDKPGLGLAANSH